MCLVLKVKQEPKPKVAKGDFYVFKAGMNSLKFFKSDWYYHLYYPGKKQVIIALKVKSHQTTPTRTHSIEEGYHSYSVRSERTKRFKEFYAQVLGVFMIPKGAKYFYDPTKREYVSNQIIYIKPYQS